MSEEMAAADPRIGINGNAVLITLFAEVQVLRQHPSLLVVVIHPGKPGILQIPKDLCPDQCAPHPAAMDLQFIDTCPPHFHEFSCRMLMRVIELSVIPAHTDFTIVHVFGIPVCVVSQADILRIIEKMSERISRQSDVIVDHQHVVCRLIDCLLGDVIARRRAVIASDEIKY